MTVSVSINAAIADFSGTERRQVSSIIRIKKRLLRMAGRELPIDPERSNGNYGLTLGDYWFAEPAARLVLVHMS
jgi:hypothetical protein